MTIPKFITYPPFEGDERVCALTTTRHGLPTMKGGSLSEGEIAHLCRVVGLEVDRLATAEQVHGHVVVRVRASGRMVLPDTDALITCEPGRILAVFTADCVPGLLYDSRSPAVGIFHAGWRGTLANIAGRTMSAMVKEFTTRPGDLLVALGPAICGENYVVGGEVGKKFISSFGENNPHITVDDGGINPDLRGLISAQLEALGVPGKSIYIHPQCTFAEESWWYSYRRDGERAGRMMSAIWLKSA